MRYLSIANTTAALFATLACANSATVQPSPASPTASTSSAAPSRGAFILLRGVDTVATERFSRTAAGLQVDFTAQGITLFHYDATLAPSATVTHMQVTTHVPGSPERVSSVTFQGDTALLMDGSDSAQMVRRAVPRGTLPYVNPSPSLMEQIVRRARVIGGSQVSVPVIIAGAAGQAAPVMVSFTGTDSVRVELSGVALLLHVDPAGGILGGTVPVQGLTIIRSAAAPQAATP